MTSGHGLASGQWQTQGVQKKLRKKVSSRNGSFLSYSMLGLDASRHLALNLITALRLHFHFVPRAFGVEGQSVIPRNIIILSQ